MTKPMIRIHDTEKDEIIDREMTDKEYKDYLRIQAEDKEREIERETKIANRKSALAKLAALGLTEDEIATL